MTKLTDKQAERLREQYTRRNGVGVDGIRAIDHQIATGVWPDVTEHGWERDDWPQIFERPATRSARPRAARPREQHPPAERARGGDALHAIQDGLKEHCRSEQVVGRGRLDVLTMQLTGGGDEPLAVGTEWVSLLSAPASEIPACFAE